MDAETDTETTKPQDAADDASHAAERYWRLWVRNWTPPFDQDAPQSASSAPSNDGRNAAPPASGG